MALIPSTIKATRPFQVFDGPIQQGQVCGFWDPGTAVLYGHEASLFGLATVGLAQVISTPTASFGPCLHELTVPNQVDPDLGPYGTPIPATFVAFCPVSTTVAILVSAVIEQSAGNIFNVEGTKTSVLYHKMSRVSPTSTTFTIGEATVAGTAWWWPEGAVDFGDGSPEDFGVLVLQGCAGTEGDPVGLACRMTRPATHPFVQYLGHVSFGSFDSIITDFTVGLENPGPFGGRTAEGQVPYNHDGAWQLAGGSSTGTTIVNRGVASGLLHSLPAKTWRPQVIGTYTPDGSGVTAPARLAWAELDGVHLSFHSVSFDPSDADVQYGVDVPLPTGVVDGLVAVDLPSYCQNIAYVPVTLMVSTATQADDGTLDGLATAYGAVVDFRAEPLLRSGWIELGSWVYHNLPGQVTLVPTGVRDTEVDLSWAPVYPGAPSSTLVYDIFQGEVVIATTALNAYTVTGLVEGTHYTFLAVARDGAGNAGPVSEPLGVTTTAPDTPPDTTPPTVPTISLVSHSLRSATVRVGGSTDDTAVAYYRIFLTGHIVGGVLVDDVSSPEIPISVTNNYDGTYTIDWASTDIGPGTHEPYYVLDDQDHYYCARAYDLAGNESGRSAFESVHFTLASTPHPTGVGLPTVTAHTDHSITLSFGAATEVGGSLPVVVDVYRNGVLHATQSASLTTYSDTFTAHSQPHYSLQARDSAGNLSEMSPSVPDWTVL